jgi:hypothetical protein
MRVVGAAPRKAEHGVAGDMAVFRQVVAGHDRKGRQAGLAAFHQRGDQDAEDGPGLIRIGRSAAISGCEASKPPVLAST